MFVVDATLESNFLLNFGLTLFGFRIKESQNENVTNFKCVYGVSPASSAGIMNDLATSQDANVRLSANAKLEHIFWALHFLKVYPKSRIMTALFGVSQRTVAYQVRRYINKIALLKDEKVRKPQHTPVSVMAMSTNFLVDLVSTPSSHY